MKPDENEIDDVLNECAEAADDGRSKYPGLSYEQGVSAALLWLRGEDENPLKN